MRTIKVKKTIANLILAFVLAACQAPQKESAPTPIADSIAMRPKVDVRKMRGTLVGKSMRDVVKAIGQPTTVYTIDEREFWIYEDIARDSITERSVRRVEVVFKQRIAQTVNFAF